VGTDHDGGAFAVPSVRGWRQSADPTTRVLGWLKRWRLRASPRRYGCGQNLWDARFLSHRLRPGFLERPHSRAAALRPWERAKAASFWRSPWRSVRMRYNSTQLLCARGTSHSGGPGRSALGCGGPGCPSLRSAVRLASWELASPASRPRCGRCSELTEQPAELRLASSGQPFDLHHRGATMDPALPIATPVPH
jgi:hypothetical protein